MKHIVVFDDLPEGGAKRVVYEQVKGLSANHVVDYITNEVETRFRFEKYAHEVFRIEQIIPRFKGMRRPLQELSYYFALAPIYQKIAYTIDQLHPDVVIVHPSRFSQAPGLLFFLNQPSIYFAEEWLRLAYEPSLHPLPEALFSKTYERLRRRWLKQIDRDAARGATAIVTTSLYMQQASAR